MPRVLLMAYHYPPLGGVAVMRVLRFSRYLSAHGWEPVVLCVDGGARHEPRDPTLVAEIPESVTVERVPCFEPDNFSDSWDQPREKVVRNLFKTFDRLLFPDDRAFWIRPAARRAREIVKQHKIDVVWATAQPWSTLVAARDLKRQTGVPLVLDFRDDWTTSNADFRKLKRLAQEQALEQTVLETADAVVSVTPHIVEELRKRAPQGMSSEQFHYIPNGFDPAHFEEPKARAERPFTIVHTGGLYHLRPITPLIEILDRWFAHHPERADQVRVVLAGSTSAETNQEIQESAWAHRIEVLGFVDHQQVRQLITEADVNLLMIERVKTAAWLFTGKVFEYIGAKRPILMLGPDPSPLATLLRETQLASVCSYEHPEETATILESLYQRRLDPPDFDSRAVERYNAFHQSAQLADIFTEVMEGARV